MPSLDALRIFPLPNVVLFPGVRLPLHIFEPPYRQMTRDALDGDRVIGMVLLRPDSPPDSGERPPVFEVGCAGEIVECEELDDGRFHLILEGVTRFRVERELDPTEGELFRRVAAAPLDDSAFEELDLAAARTMQQDRAFIERDLLELVERATDQSPDSLRARLAELDAVELVHAVAFGIDATPLEKQALLEAESTVERGHMLRNLIEFRRAEAALGDAPKQVN